MTPFRFEKTFSEWRVCDVRSEGKSRAYLFFFLFFRREINRNDIKKRKLASRLKKECTVKCIQREFITKKKKTIRKGI